MMKKLKTIWQLLRAEHYALLLGDSDKEISWAMETLKIGDNLTKPDTKLLAQSKTGEKK